MTPSPEGELNRSPDEVGRLVEELENAGDKYVAAMSAVKLMKRAAALLTSLAEKLEDARVEAVFRTAEIAALKEALMDLVAKSERIGGRSCYQTCDSPKHTLSCNELSDALRRARSLTEPKP